MTKFKAGDRVRLIKFPVAKGTVVKIHKDMVWCSIDADTNVAFGRQDVVELDPEA